MTILIMDIQETDYQKEAQGSFFVLEMTNKASFSN